MQQLLRLVFFQLVHFFFYKNLFVYFQIVFAIISFIKRHTLKPSLLFTVHQEVAEEHHHEGEDHQEEVEEVHPAEDVDLQPEDVDHQPEEEDLREEEDHREEEGVHLEVRHHVDHQEEDHRVAGDRPEEDPLEEEVHQEEDHPEEEDHREEVHQEVEGKLFFRFLFFLFEKTFFTRKIFSWLQIHLLTNLFTYTSYFCSLF